MMLTRISLTTERLLPEITSDSAQALEAQRQFLAQEAAAEMMRRDARSADVLFRLGSELQQSQAELRKHLEVQLKEPK